MFCNHMSDMQASGTSREHALKLDNTHTMHVAPRESKQTNLLREKGP